MTLFIKYKKEKKLKAKCIEAHDLNNNKIFTYKSLNQASKNLGIHHQFINKHLERNNTFTSREVLILKFKLVN